MKQWRTDRHLAINTVQPNFNAARFLIDEIEVHQLRYADVFLAQSHDIAQKISLLDVVVSFYSVGNHHCRLFHF